MNKDIERIKSWKTCEEGLVWAETQSSLEEVWDKCEEPSWLFFICKAEAGLNLKKEQAVAIAIAFANRVIERFESACPDDDRPRKAIKAAQAWLDNPTEENVVAAALAARQAASATGDAANAAYAASAAAAHAAGAAAYAAHAAGAAAYAASAAYAAAYAAYAAAYTAAAAARAAAYAANVSAAAAARAADAVAAARSADAVGGYAAASAERKAQADIFRLLVPNPFK